jgi:hypothetical protein
MTSRTKPALFPVGCALSRPYSHLQAGSTRFHTGPAKMEWSYGLRPNKENLCAAAVMKVGLPPDWA